MTVTNKRLAEILTTAMEKPEIANALIQRVINTLNKQEQREWQGLTDEDRQEIERWIEFKEAGGNEPVPAQKIITYVEAKLKEKNT